MNKYGFALISLIAMTWLSSASTIAQTANKDRSFQFQYGFSVQDVPQNANVRVWFPIAESNGQQTVKLTNELAPDKIQKNRESRYENLIGYFEGTQNSDTSIDVNLTYDVVRKEASLDGADKVLGEAEKNRFLQANALVPIDGRPQELIEDVELPSDPMQVGQSLYNVVEQHMKYDKSKPGYGTGNAVWACDSRFGNCTDFHSLFISLARSRSVPARFEIGFPLPADKKSGSIGGYHCWAWFHVAGKGWAPVDISEADKHPEMKDYYFGNLTPDRISFSTGRDIDLVPAAKAGKKNYFVYPHVEVDGAVWPKEKIKLDFKFRDR